MEPTTNPNNADPKKTKLLLIGGAAVVVVAIIAVTFATSNHGATPTATPTPQASATPAHISDPLLAPGTPVPAQLVASVVAFVQSRENNVGANQTSPTAWLKAIQPFLVPSYFNQLQPPLSSRVDGGSAEFKMAHDNNYIVNAVVTSCVWDVEQGQPTTTKGDVVCDVTDNTTKGINGPVIPDSGLPFGWTRTGRQPAAIVEAVNQNGTWLINKDASNEFE